MVKLTTVDLGPNWGFRARAQYVTYNLGVHEFTTQAFSSKIPSSATPGKDESSSLRGKTFIVTGGNSGIGKGVAIRLASKGAQVHIICRREDAAKEAVEEIKAAAAAAAATAATSSGDETQQQEPPVVEYHILDMSSVKAVHNFAKDWVAKKRGLDGLCNNAGMMSRKWVVTSENLELNFALNVMGGYVLTEALMPAFRPGARVVSISSGRMLAHPKLAEDDMQSGKIDWERPEAGPLAYSRNKRAMTSLSEAWQSECQAKGLDITFYSVNPGWVDTPAVRAAIPAFHAEFKEQLRTAEQGADTPAWLLCRERAPRPGFYLDRKPQPTHLPMSLFAPLFALDYWLLPGARSKAAMKTYLESVYKSLVPDKDEDK